MDKMFVVKSIQFRPVENPDSSWTEIENLGFSIVRLMPLSGCEATGVRADLQIKDQEVLDSLARYYAQNTRLEWWFETGGGGGSFTVGLRWTKFDRLTGSAKGARTAVLRDLISEAEQNGTTGPDQGASPPPSGRNETSTSESQGQDSPERTEPDPEASSGSQPSGFPLVRQVFDLWSILMGKDGRPNREQVY